MRNSSNSLYKYVLIIVIISVFGFLSTNNNIIGTLWVSIQCIILLILLLINKFKKFYIFYVIFTTSSIEFSFDTSYTSTLFNFRNYNIIGVSTSVIFAIIGIIYLIIFKQRARLIVVKNNYFYNFLLVLCITGTFVGLFNLYNGAAFLEYYIKDIYYGIYVLLILYMAVYLVNEKKENSEELKIVLQAMIIGSVVSSLISIPLNISYSYGGVDILPYTQAILFSPFLILIAIYEKGLLGKILIYSGIIGSALIVYFNASGKGLLNIIITFILLLYILYRNNNVKLSKLSVFVLIFVPPIVFLIFKDNITGNVLFMSKLNQVVTLFNYHFDLDSIANSPRYRITEFININRELFNNPISLIFGKGYGGGFEDYYGYFKSGNLGAFSATEYKLGVYFNPHEALNVILLKHGYLGLILLIFLFIKYFRYVKQSGFIFIGLYWVLIIYGFSNVFTILGVISFVIGIVEIRKKRLYQGNAV